MNELERAYPMLTRRQTLSFPLVGIATCLGMGLLLRAIDGDGFTWTPFVLMTPLMALGMLVPVWGLGGRVVVIVRRGELRVRRERFLVRGVDKVVRFAPSSPPEIVVQRLGGKWRHQGVLRAETDETSTVLVASALAVTLDAIARDVRAAVSAAPPSAGRLPRS